MKSDLTTSDVSKEIAEKITRWAEKIGTPNFLPKSVEASFVTSFIF